ncbi:MULTISPECIES: PH domain-containing protein [Aerococcus]|uniref:PH domain-containing protein n=1 Tax=Aerococcus TaxID=1375 RepID=UPI000DCF5D2F|nr:MULTISPECIES: PH domain-containing protein [Aerococcus]KAA9234744.1 PH domain-containing protein [Aerococcus mictus]MDK6291031.1 PH domain-containing protein [Aerococcus urinae]MDK6375581.1 PH domain-containing protein [Aerococcus urinae]MDK6421398.1 PH domain-containing protein [Aerococcus urinae]MDK8074475.1 PH domain-containing protein [Aerococcus urinae]
MAFNLNNFMQGALGNFSQKDQDELNEEYGDFLFKDEEIYSGYQLVRDAIIFTNIRIILVDKQGASGKKTAFRSLYLSHIVDVEMESAGLAFDDSEITITYLNNIYRRPREEDTQNLTFEFPKQTDILPLYRFLGNLVVENRREINQ